MVHIGRPSNDELFIYGIVIIEKEGLRFSESGKTYALEF
jgi:hypothetical protein